MSVNRIVRRNKERAGEVKRIMWYDFVKGILTCRWVSPDYKRGEAKNDKSRG